MKKIMILGASILQLPSNQESKRNGTARLSPLIWMKMQSALKKKALFVKS